LATFEVTAGEGDLAHGLPDELGALVERDGDAVAVGVGGAGLAARGLSLSFEVTGRASEAIGSSPWIAAMLGEGTPTDSRSGCSIWVPPG
jgi:hypothetical protein